MPISRTATFANLSTGHLTGDVCRELSEDQNDLPLDDYRDRLIYLSREYGFWMYVPSVEVQPTVDGIPQCILDCWAVARQDGADWILFDRDEDAIEDLPWYDGGNSVVPLLPEDLLSEAA